MLYPKNRVIKFESVDESIQRIPFLKKFLTPYAETHMEEYGHIRFINFENVGSIICRHKINDYMGFEMIKEYSPSSEDTINPLFEEAERRGDL